jgi:hypothetical protein
MEVEARPYTHNRLALQSSRVQSIPYTVACADKGWLALDRAQWTQRLIAELRYSTWRGASTSLRSI